MRDYHLAHALNAKLCQSYAQNIKAVRAIVDGSDSLVMQSFADRYDTQIVAVKS